MARERRLQSEEEFGVVREATDQSRYADRKTSVYLGAEVMQEIKEEAARLDRSFSWTLQTAWRLAKEQIRQMPAMSDAEETSGDETHLDSTDD